MIWWCMPPLNYAISMNLIDLLVRVTNWEWKLALKRPRYSENPRRCHSKNRGQCNKLQESSNTLQQIEKIKHFEVVFTSDRRQNNEVNTGIGKANAVLRELYRSLVTKRELSNTAKLSVFISVFVRILVYDHESWVMTKRVLSQAQATEMRFAKSSWHDNQWRN